MGHAPGLWNPSSATVAPKLCCLVLSIGRGARWYAPETWNPSSATVALKLSSFVLFRRFGWEGCQVARTRDMEPFLSHGGSHGGLKAHSRLGAGGQEAAHYELIQPLLVQTPVPLSCTNEALSQAKHDSKAGQRNGLRDHSQ